MRMLRYNFISTFFAAIIACGLSGCEDDMPDVVYNDNWASDEYFIIGGNDPDSRVAYENEHVSTFESGDIVGAFSFDGSGALIESNVPMTVEARENLNTGQKIQALVARTDKELSRGMARYLFYYPYDASMTIDKARDYTHSVKTDQSIDKEGALSFYEQSDLLWDYVTPGEKNVHIIFDHAMANILVIVPEKDAKYYKDITVHGQPLTATGINLSTENLSAMSYEVADDQPLCDIVMTHPINSKREGKEDEGKLLVYRAAVPACRTISATEGAFLTVENTNNTTKNYRLKKDIRLLPGHNYYFTISSFTPPVIDVEDEDTWVLEVYDPEDGELVGYLCREYLYWPGEAEGASNYMNASVKDDEHTFALGKGNLGRDFNYMVATCPGGTDSLKQQLTRQGYEGDQNNFKLAVNSQAWVFYNLKTPEIPDLSQGTVLRFLFDIKCSSNMSGNTPYIVPKYTHTLEKTTAAIWPYPHKVKIGQGQGLFRTRHGHDRVNTYLVGNMNGDTSNEFFEQPHSGYDSEEWVEFYMHGGTIKWNGPNNHIESFTMPDRPVTNSEAYLNGHIAVTTVDGQKVAHVSYDPIVDDTHDINGNRIAYVIPKVIPVGEVLYPLRKVGFNQFWFGFSLKSTLDAAGDPLICYNDRSETSRTGAVTFEDYLTNSADDGSENKIYGSDEILDPGYLYPTGRKGKNSSQKGVPYDEDFDPARDESLRGHIALLYNYTTILKGNMVPSKGQGMSFYIPTWNDILRLRRYGGFAFAAKWITDEVRTRDDSLGEDYKKFSTESTTDALKEGKLLYNESFCANISGLDFRCFGFKSTGHDIADFGGACYFYIDSSKNNYFGYTGMTGEAPSDIADTWLEVFRFKPWDCWDIKQLKELRDEMHQPGNIKNMSSDGYKDDQRRANSRSFYPIRIIMEFDNQDYNTQGSHMMISRRRQNIDRPRHTQDNPVKYHLLDIDELK